MAALQDYTRLKRGGRAAQPARRADLAWSLVLDSLVFAAEAEIRWLDHCEARRAPRRDVSSADRAAPTGPRRRDHGDGPMSALLELEQAARLHRAEDRWLDQCADRLRRAAPASDAARRPPTPPTQEVVR